MTDNAIIDRSTAPRNDFPPEIEVKAGIDLKVVQEVIIKSKKIVYKDRFLNGKECETLIADRVKDIALSLLDEYGWKDHPCKNALAELMVSEAEWESDMMSTKLVMMTVFIREKDKHDSNLAIQKISKSN